MGNDISLPPIWSADQGDIPEEWQDLFSLSLAFMCLMVAVHRVNSLSNRTHVSIDGGEEPLNYRGLMEPVKSSFQTCQLFASLSLLVTPDPPVYLNIAVFSALFLVISLFFSDGI